MSSDSTVAAYLVEREGESDASGGLGIKTPREAPYSGMQHRMACMLWDQFGLHLGKVEVEQQ